MEGALALSAILISSESLERLLVPLQNTAKKKELSQCENETEDYHLALTLEQSNLEFPGEQRF